MIERCLSSEQPGWLSLRRAVWPGWGDAEHLQEMAAVIAASATEAAFIASDSTRRPQGFVEVGLRYEHVNGATSSPVAFLEGIYVAPEFRGRGVARQLVDVAETWASALGYTELASDVLIDNADGLALHDALGFRETERVIFFVKALR